MCLDNYLYAVSSSQRNELRHLRLSTRVKVRLRILQDDQTARTGAQECQNDGQCIGDTETDIARTERIGDTPRMFERILQVNDIHLREAIGYDPHARGDVLHPGGCLQIKPQ